MGCALWGRALGPVVAAENAAPAAPAAAPGEVMVSHVGMTREAFVGTNENDTKAAYRALNAELGKKHGDHFVAEITVFDNLADFRQAIQLGRVTFIITSSWDYLAMGIEDAADIEFVPTSDRDAAHRWLLLVRQDSRFKSAQDLEGGKVLVLHTPTASLGERWLETIGPEAGAAGAAHSFASLVTVTKPIKAILPVFFGKADACVVDEVAFKVMVEMNPQVGRTLHPIAQSEPLVASLICFSRTGWSPARLRAHLSQTLPELHTDLAGQQVLTLFKCERLLPFEPAQLDSVRRLFARHRQLQNTPSP